MRRFRCLRWFGRLWWAGRSRRRRWLGCRVHFPEFPSHRRTSLHLGCAAAANDHSRRRHRTIGQTGCGRAATLTRSRGSSGRKERTNGRQTGEGESGSGASDPATTSTASGSAATTFRARSDPTSTASEAMSDRRPAPPPPPPPRTPQPGDVRTYIVPPPTSPPPPPAPQAPPPPPPKDR